MYRIVPGIASLRQHLETLSRTPQIYRPARCPHCGLGKVFRHGCYMRKAARNRESDGASNPIPIPRYLCCGCRRTCSRLPACIAPRRWHGWGVQQIVLQLLLTGASLRQCGAAMHLDRRTVRRWRDWLNSRSEAFAFFLRARFPELGRTADWRSFWIACFKRMPLCEAMALLDRDGVIVP